MNTTSIGKYYHLQTILMEAVSNSNITSRNLNESVFMDNRSLVPTDVLFETIDARLNATLESNLIFRPLTESTEFVNVFSEYLPLIEAVDTLDNIKRDLAGLTANSNKTDTKDKDSIFRRIADKAKAAWNWWYKADPNKKFKTLHVILKIAVSILLFVASLYLTGKVIKPIVGKVLGTKAISGIKDVHIFGNTKWSLKKLLVELGIGAIFGQIASFITDIFGKLEYLTNKKDMDKNIAAYDTLIRRCDNLLYDLNNDEDKNELMKLKNSLVRSQATLIRMKDKYAKKKDDK